MDIAESQIDIAEMRELPYGSKPLWSYIPLNRWFI